ncbi:patatin-like phospholipase family protein [Simiduia sp. 21SJ11W-1]|uniref:patatin-like phospholipase family protein n=1 Tax=Simiduia sp. 21SJ11W-1 TaxID=2909669 RepID=UPI00209CE374|nr:patatin-like phospholipase family protein [Simiduia sp. 21SJ11W-1]UTA48163.1 patatin-like phospholipase family protein [Simiduia sp. 21SJ11W-1]
MAETSTFEQVQAAEQGWLAERRSKAGVDASKPVLGLAFSGGGIRSACFHLGVLQALQASGKLREVDYLSSVSGGGYIGACFQWLKHFASDANNETLFSQPAGNDSVLDWLRAHGKFLIDGKSVSSITLASGLLASTLFNLLIVVPLLLAIVWLAGLPHTSISWPGHWHLPGAENIEGHAGYLIALWLSAASLGLFLLSIPTMALWRQHTRHHSFRARRRQGQLLGFSLVAGLVGSLPIAAQLGDALVAAAESEALGDWTTHLNYALPFLGGLATLWRSKSRPRLALLGLTLLLYGLAAAAYHCVFHIGFADTRLFHLWLGVALVLLAWASINRTSMHSYYLAQLCNAFFAPIRAVPAQQNDTLLASLTPGTGAPLPLINTTLSTRNSPASLWRARLGASFTLSPLYCGAPATGFAPTAQFQYGRLTLGEAMTTSGAAVDPGTAQTANSSLSFLMALLNFRLGYWVRAPRAPVNRWQRMPYWLIAREMFGAGLGEQYQNLHLTDGGHFENLGVYELLRREVPLIIAGDAGADPTTSLADLGLLIQRAEADFNCQISIDTSALTLAENGLHNACHATGKIHYASGRTGTLVFVKSLLTANSSAQVQAFAKLDPTFPNDSTANQFYDEQHFDAYRKLGYENMQAALASADI